MKKYVIYRNNINYPYKAIVVNEEDICVPNEIGLFMYFNEKNKRFEVCKNNECDFSTGGIFAGELLLNKTNEEAVK